MEFGEESIWGVFLRYYHRMIEYKRMEIDQIHGPLNLWVYRT